MSRSRIRGFFTDLNIATDPEAMNKLAQSLSAIYAITFPQRYDDTFRFCGTTWQFPDAFLHTASGSAMTMKRSQAMVERSPIDQVSIFYLVKGEVSSDYDGLVRSVRPGDLLFIDYMKPMMSETTAFVSHTVTLARNALPNRFQDGSMHGTILRGGEPVTELLARHFAVLVDLVDRLAMSEAQAALNAFVSLFGTLWPDLTAMPRSKETAAALQDRAIALIRANLSDPRLSPALIAFSLSISRASLYALFQVHGGVSAVIQKMRLDESLKALVQGSSGPGSVAEIAKRFGFKSGAHFSRAFSARFGRSPRDVTILSGEDTGGLKYASWLAAQNPEVPPEMIIGWLAATEIRAEHRAKPKTAKRKTPIAGAV